MHSREVCNLSPTMALVMTRSMRTHVPPEVFYTIYERAFTVEFNPDACSGISVSNTPGAVDASTANTALYLLLGALRRIHIPTLALRSGQWRGHMGLGHDPEGKTLGILGMGGIGSAVARRAVAFDFKIQYHNRRPVPADQNPFGAKYVDFATLLRTSDAISVHLPLCQSTRGLIGKKEFAMMKEGVVIVNTARGPIIDEKALVEAVQSGKVFGAGLDVYEKEPEVSEGLVGSENVVLLPHVGTATYETQVCFLIFPHISCMPYCLWHLFCYILSRGGFFTTPLPFLDFHFYREDRLLLAKRPS